MRFLANENFPKAAVDRLVSEGHDVEWVRETAPGATDRDVIARAEREQRILLTFDKDFGTLAFATGLPLTCGIVLFRMPMPSPDSVGEALAARLAEREDWAGHFSVIEPNRIRMRALEAR